MKWKTQKIYLLLVNAVIRDYINHEYFFFNILLLSLLLYALNK